MQWIHVFDIYYFVTNTINLEYNYWKLKQINYLSVSLGHDPGTFWLGPPLKDSPGWNQGTSRAAISSRPYGSSSYFTAGWQNSIPCSCRTEALSSKRPPTFCTTWQFAPSWPKGEALNPSDFQKNPIRSGPPRIISFFVNSKSTSQWP